MRLMTEGQRSFLTDLYSRAFGADAEDRLTDLFRQALTIDEASLEIDRVKPLARAAAYVAGPEADLAEGYYVRDGEVYVIVRTKDGHRTYAKHLEFSGHGHASWVYQPGARRALIGLEALTIEEAARLGHLHGVCVICARALTDPISVERGIGPVCVKKLERAGGLRPVF